jgi:hypothetical protein
MPNKFPKDSEMSDAVYSPVITDPVYAKRIIDEIWPIKVHGRSVIGMAFEALQRLERAMGDEARRERKRQWTERRVRSIIDDEEPCLEHYEITDLEKMAVKEGRNAYRKSVERAARLAAFLAVADEDFYLPQIEAQMAMARSLHRAGDQLAVGGAGEGGAGADLGGELAGRVRGPGDRR